MLEFEDIVQLLLWIILWIKVVELAIIIIIGILFANNVTEIPNTYGTHTGYVTAVDGGYFASKFYFKTELSSSQEDEYCIENDNENLQVLRGAQLENKKITLEYKEYLTGFAMRECSTKILNVK